MTDYDLWLVRGGAGEARISALPPVSLTPGTLLVLRPGDRGHVTQHSDAPVSVTFCHFQLLDPVSGAAQAIPSALAPARVHQVELGGPIATGLEALVRVIRGRPPMARLRARTLLGQLLTGIYGLPTRVGSDAEGEASIVRRAATLVDADPGHRHRVDEIAGAVGVHPRRLAPLFRAHLGMSFREYVLESRLRRAQVLIGETDIPITAVARMLGYPDHTLLSKQFLARFGVSPRAYRES